MIFIILFYNLLAVLNQDSQPSKRWLVELKSDESKCLNEWWLEQRLDQKGYYKKNLSIGNWTVIQIPSQYISGVEQLSCVVQMREDKLIQWRDTEPNDPAYINQIDMELIGMAKAWDIARGGVTAQGDTIVVAIIDSGIQTDHVDLRENIWSNKSEIPDDAVDNDANGYIDDYLGLNISTGNDDHNTGNHGTSVAGIIGAKGNNAIGVTGVNWNVKLMLISGADFESELIESYEYVLQMRKKYRLTNGLEGAFVVVTNLSGGIENAFAADHPLWCEMYDKLGQEGVLSVTAAPNNGVSVDLEGDMPTTCTSPFMIAVTNVDLTDAILANAGFGTASIDLGAPGHGTITTSGNNTYKEFPGTSAAAPHVTGAIALMYGTPCSTFLENLDNDLGGVALMIKDIILTTGRDNSSLEGMTVTGKRLQVDAAMRETVSECDDLEVPVLRINSVRPNPSSIGDIVQIYFEVNADTTSALFDIHTLDGRLVKTYDISDAEFAQGAISFKVRPVAAGGYLVTLRNKDEKHTVKVMTGF